MLQKALAKFQGDYSLRALRDKLILSFRLFLLFRSIDLARTFRKISEVNGQFFVLAQRKGWHTPRWVQVPSLPSLLDLCPMRALLNYVNASAQLAAPGSPLFISLQPPFLPLSSNSLSRITREMLSLFGVNSVLWKPHSTRGAGVSMFKNLGLTSEQVCELGAWKNSATFGQFYLRLNVAQNLHSFVEKLNVHKVSPRNCAELDQTRTPETERDSGGSVWQGIGEPTPPTQTKQETVPSPSPLFHTAATL